MTRVSVCVSLDSSYVDLTRPARRSSVAWMILTMWVIRVVRDAGRMRVEGKKQPEENAKERESTRVWKDFKVCVSRSRLG